MAPFVLGEKGIPGFADAGPREAWDAFRPVGEPRAFGRDVLMTFDRTD